MPEHKIVLIPTWYEFVMAVPEAAMFAAGVLPPAVIGHHGVLDRTADKSNYSHRMVKMLQHISITTSASL